MRAGTALAVAMLMSLFDGSYIKQGDGIIVNPGG
jgi:hypothetical protein